MQTYSAPGVLILGVNGRFGRAAAAAFANAGWRVYAQSRSPLKMPVLNATPVICDALDTTVILEAVMGKIDVLVNALNPPYTDWEQRVPALANAALHIADTSGALLMLPGNVYNFGSSMPAVLDETTPQRPDRVKGKIRVALEEEMCKASNKVRSVVIRAGDFLGGTGPGTWMDRLIARDLDKGKVIYPGPLCLQHAWAYVPDLAKVFVEVANRRHQLEPFEVFHYSGLMPTGRELTDAITHAAARPLKLKQFPWWLPRLASPFSPMLRAILEMRYLWQTPHRLSEEKLARLIGEIPRTNLDEVVRIVLSGNALTVKGK